MLAFVNSVTALLRCVFGAAKPQLQAAHASGEGMFSFYPVGLRQCPRETDSTISSYLHMQVTWGESARKLLRTLRHQGGVA